MWFTLVAVLLEHGHQGLAVVAHTGLRERAFGDFEGRTFAEIEAELPEHARHWRQRTPDWAPPGAGERHSGWGIDRSWMA